MEVRRIVLAMAAFLCLAWGGQALAADAKQTEQAKKTDKKQEEGAQTEHKMPEMVVTATRTEIEKDKAPSSVTIITKEEMERKNVRTIDDALKNVVGVYARRSRGVADSATGSVVTMRGLSNAKRSLVLVDGIPFNDSYSAGVTWSSIPVDSVDRIEIIRGPGSALYGGNAMGGVINIILKVPMKTQAQARGGFGYGEGNREESHDAFYNYRWGVNAGTRLGDQMSLFAGYEGEISTGYPSSLVVKSATTAGGTGLTGGYPMPTSAGANGWVVGDSGNNNGERQVVNALAAWDLSDTGRLRADMIYGYHFYDYGQPNSYVGAFSGRARTGRTTTTSTIYPSDFNSGMGLTEDIRTSLSYDDLLFDKVRIKAVGSFWRENNWYTQPNSSNALGYSLTPGTMSENVRDTWYGSLQADIPIFEGNTLTIGGDLRHNSIDLKSYNLARYREISSKIVKTDLSQGYANNWAAFIQDEWKLPYNFTLYTGARLDYYVAYGGKSGNVGAVNDINSSEFSEISPRASLVWNPWDDTTLRVGASKGFRAPNLYETMRAWTSAGTSPVTYLPNPNLAPETLWTYEAGLQQYFWERKAMLGVTVFHTDFDNYIDSVNVNGNSRLKRQENIGSLTIEGVEFEAQIKPWEFLTLWGNLALTSPKVDKFDLYPEYEGNYLTTVPLTQANIGADITYGQFKFGVSGNYVGRVYANSDNKDQEDVYGTYSERWLWDAKVTYSPTKYTDVSLSVLNIFNEKYFQYYVGQPRTVMLEVALKY